MNKITLREIVKNYDEFVFVSPHLDDAALSCGQLILELLKKRKKVSVVNIFTKAHKGPYTLSAKKYLIDSGGYSDATDLYKKRIEEDKAALSSIKVENIINLGFCDALFRKRESKNPLGKYISELDHYYPTYRWHVLGERCSHDVVSLNLQRKLKKIVNKNAMVVAPYGVGGHVDHLITRAVCEELFKNIVLYSDFPYNIRSKNFGEKTGKQVFELEPDMSRKEKIARMYESQFGRLFPDNKMPKHKEVYFIKRLR